MKMKVIAFFVICRLSVIVKALYPPNSDVTHLTSSSFRKEVLDSDQVWLVEFYAPWCGHCQAFASEYQKAAQALKGVVKVGAVNADEHKDLAGQYGIKGYPTVKVFNNKKKPDDYNGARSAQGLIDASFKALRSKVDQLLYGKDSSESQRQKKSDTKDVIELTDSNFDELVLGSDDIWLVEFYAPWCGHCKNLAPHWASAATQLKGKIKLGAIDATVNTLKSSKYGIQGFPTIKYFGPEKNAPDYTPEDYQGDRTADQIVFWAQEKLSENIPAPQIVQLTDEEALKSACWDHHLCVTALLPHILDCQSECRHNYLNMLQRIAEKYKKKMWGWVWAEAGSQPHLEESLEIGGFGYPAMVVINPKKLKFSTFKGSFSFEGINEFLRDLSYGKGSTVSLKTASLPTVQAISPWDGKDGVLKVTDDIDVSDIDLEPLDSDSSHKDEL